jgi:hypothetical protein
MKWPAGGVECAAPYCDTEVDPSELLCRPHWHIAGRRAHDRVTRTHQEFAAALAHVDEARATYEAARARAVDNVRGAMAEV